MVSMERLRAIGLEVNGSKCELTILNDSTPEQRRPCSEGSFRGLGWLKRVTFLC